MNRNIARLPEIPPARLVDHNAAVRQTVSVSLLPATQQQRPHGRCLADAHGVHRRVDVSHGVVYREAGGNRAAGGIDVERDRLRWGVGFEKEELCDYGGGEGVVHLAVQADDALLEELGEDVGCTG